MIYCSNECQKDDWNRGHKLECHRMFRDHNDLVADGLELSSQARIHYMEMISLWINARADEDFFNKFHRLKAKVHPSLPRCEAVHIAKIFIAE
ncbi:hypothetical protein BKA70DRAFT_1290059 [Coprinopsis sp. MPI-PUGE-AT-0042]|nr:hypothetical protein BKA70DRAFT_1290059 [Coprinopsis sp. MPI-PUGE-AT-0042]